MRPRALAVVVLGLAACGESEVSDLTYADVRAAARDQESFRTWFREVRGEQVAWTGRVVEVATEHGDEFVEVTVLSVDLDGAEPEIDARSEVSADEAEALSPGDEISFRARLENYEWTGDRPLLQLALNELEPAP